MPPQLRDASPLPNLPLNFNLVTNQNIPANALPQRQNFVATSSYSRMLLNHLLSIIIQMVQSNQQQPNQ